MAAEQTILNAAVLTVEATAASAALADRLRLLIARPAPALPVDPDVAAAAMAGLEAREGDEGFGRAIRITILAIAGFALVVAVVLLAIGPWVMDLLFGGDFEYGRVGLAIVALGMGLHLVADAQQAALAALGGLAAAAWLLAAAAFVGFLFVAVGDEVLRVELAYFGAGGDPLRPVVGGLQAACLDGWRRRARPATTLHR